MTRFIKEKRILELEAEDEPIYRIHFANARKAWKTGQEVADASYRYMPDADGVWGFSPNVPRRDYFWPRALLES